ncbi:CBS domain-containing protein [Noviherbaspirillum saxi]|uniref:CBS domain-containing protein n=1 Tax=Noviherbaspirillum saxi TaxID=2320863 RepID=UPI0030833429
MKPHPFRDRRDAGRQLAAALAFLRSSRPVVLALPRGGVPVAYEVAIALDAPLDLLLARKIPAPGFSEFGIGAVVDGDPPIRVLNRAAVERLQPSTEYLEAEVQRQLAEIARRRLAYCGERAPISVIGRNVILVDDGAATGGTMKAALRALAGMRTGKLVFALPVAPSDTLSSLQAEADEGICLVVPPGFRAVSQYYDDFAQTGDDEVTALLAAAASRELVGVAAMENVMKTLAQAMTHDVSIVGPHDNVQRAALIMSDWDVGVLPVCDGQRLIGMITERDIALQTAAGRTAEEIRVADVMTDEVEWCFEDQDTAEVLQRMKELQLSRIPVLDRDMRLVGMVALKDLAPTEDVPAEPSAAGDEEGKEIVRLRRPQSDQADGWF